MTTLLNVVIMQIISFAIICHRLIFFIFQVVYFIEPTSTEGRADTAGKEYQSLQALLFLIVLQ
jgi:hypothetical protein